MNKEKGLSAIAGTVLMVAIVIAIAAVVYVYVNNWEENQGKCRNTMMNITDYGIGADGQLFFNVNVTNPGGNLTANFTITVNALAIENRIEKGAKETYNTTIQRILPPGQTIQSVGEITKLDQNMNYRVEVKIMTKYLQTPMVKELYIFASK